ncbi:MAG: VanZ family protein [Microbacterium sp.]|uniref:VanZ family protein n=1 Tax=Microbacterium sp. TaxID=51671 RepID=UPI003F7E8357
MTTIPLLAVYGVVLALIAFWPVPVDRGATGMLRGLARFVPVLTYDRVEFGANVLLFVPLGVLLAVAMPRRRVFLVPFALLLSGAIEAGQAIFLDERTATFRDIVANTIGATIGLVIVLVAERVSSGAVVVADRTPRADDGEGVEGER